MLWSENKQEKDFHYKCEDVFGIINIWSINKLTAEQLDDIFLAIFEASKFQSAETITGQVDGIDNVHYSFKKINQWQDMEKIEQDEKQITKEDLSEDASKIEDNINYGFWGTNLLKFIPRLLRFYKESKKLNQLLQLESDTYLQCRDGASEREVVLKRDGKDVTVKEIELWEAQRFGSQEALDFIKTKYSELWMIAEMREDQKNKCDAILTLLFGFNLTEMTPYKIVRIIQTFTIAFTMIVIPIILIALVLLAWIS